MNDAEGIATRKLAKLYVEEVSERSDCEPCCYRKCDRKCDRKCASD